MQVFISVFSSSLKSTDTHKFLILLSGQNKRMHFQARDMSIAKPRSLYSFPIFGANRGGGGSQLPNFCQSAGQADQAGIIRVLSFLWIIHNTYPVTQRLFKIVTAWV